MLVTAQTDVSSKGVHIASIPSRRTASSSTWKSLAHSRNDAEPVLDAALVVVGQVEHEQVAEVEQRPWHPRLYESAPGVKPRE
jgi:hypothetical protein